MLLLLVWRHGQWDETALQTESERQLTPMTKSASFSALLAAPAIACCFFTAMIARQYEVCEYG